MILSNKDIIETILEVRSHSGLPINYYPGAIQMLGCIQKIGDIKNPKLITYLKNEILNQCMKEVHKCRRKGINKNIKSYDW